MATHWKSEGFNPIIDRYRVKPKVEKTGSRYRDFTKQEIDTIVGHMYHKPVPEIYKMIGCTDISERTFINRVYWMRKHPNRNFYKKVCTK